MCVLTPNAPISRLLKAFLHVSCAAAASPGGPGPPTLGLWHSFCQIIARGCAQYGQGKMTYEFEEDAAVGPQKILRMRTSPR